MASSTRSGKGKAVMQSPPGPSRPSDQENIPPGRQPLADRQQRAKRTAALTPEISPVPSTRRQRLQATLLSPPRGAASIGQHIARVAERGSPTLPARARTEVQRVSLPAMYEVVLLSSVTWTRLANLQVVAPSQFLPARIQTWPSWLLRAGRALCVRKRAVPSIA